MLSQNQAEKSPITKIILFLKQCKGIGSKICTFEGQKVPIMRSYTTDPQQEILEEKPFHPGSSE